MRLLLDTHLFLWAVAGSPQLKPSAKRIIDAADKVHVSAASLWEIAIKARLGKIEADAGEMLSAIDASGFFELPVTAAHAAAVAQLPPHHRDPFDRLLLAQCISEPLRFLTVDGAFGQYSDLVTVLD
jgi:PIN domain nuclease of toxin-antitoxin system